MGSGNLYVHFPFCRRKCSYCALYSRAGASAEEMGAYVRSLVPHVRGKYATAYFGGGTPALCDLKEIAGAIEADEFTVELHPLDASADLLSMLADAGVNRISMGVQSLDDRTLEAMGRGYTAAFAAKAFSLVRGRFDNAGVDFIVGYPGDPGTDLGILREWGARHCSAYTLQNERGLRGVASDEEILDKMKAAAAELEAAGLVRYEISNFALPGYECRHNMAVWRGEDYIGIGEGACGRVGLVRTRNAGTSKFTSETLTPERDAVERAIFSLRTREGLDTERFPQWRKSLDGFAAEGLLVREGARYRLTTRGMEVCDSILAAIV